MKNVIKYLLCAEIIFLLVAMFSANAEENFRPFKTEKLKLKENIQLFFLPTEAYTQGGVIWVGKGAETPVELSLNNTKEYFREIENAEQAKELCELMVWGCLVENKESFRKILDLYKESGFKVPDNLSEDMTFTYTALAAGTGFDVEFTAFILHRGMGASAAVERLHFHVDKEGAVELSKKIEYLHGPGLNWQTGLLDDKAEKKNKDEYRKRKILIDKIYLQCPALLPRQRRL